MKIYILAALLGLVVVEGKVYFQETFSDEGEYWCVFICVFVPVCVYWCMCVDWKRWTDRQIDTPGRLEGVVVVTRWCTCLVVV